MGMFSTNTTVTASGGAATANADLRVASLSIAAYECVSSCVSLPLIVTHILPAISLPSLWNIGCTKLPIEGCKNICASLRRYNPDLDIPVTRCTLLILFILIRYVFSTPSFVICSHRYCRYCSVTLLTLSNVGFFYHHFSLNHCRYYYHATLVFKRRCRSSAPFGLEVEKFRSNPSDGVASDPRYSVSLECLCLSPESDNELQDPLHFPT
jgi:hypothetical protein